MRLSVCIPTHHGRGDDLAATLERLLGQIAADAPGAVEVCVTDNASADGTEAMVARLIAGGAPVRYLRHPRDIGVARNILASVAQATGEWCWLHASDDLIADDALATVLETIAAHPDAVGVTVSRAVFDLEMIREQGVDNLAVLPADSERARTFTDPLEAIAQLGMIHTYLPSQIVRRAAWDAVIAADPQRPLAASAYYPHNYVIARILIETGRPWVWVPDKLIMTRPRHDVASLGGSELAAALGQPADLVRAWTVALGGPGTGPLPRHRPLRRRAAALHRALLERAAGVWAVPAALDAFKARRGHTLRDDARMLVRLVAVFWSLPAFWRTAVPHLLRPHLLVKAARRRDGTAARRSRPAPGDLAIAVAAALPVHADVGRNLFLSCEVANHSSHAIDSDEPDPVTIGARWVNAAGTAVRELDRVRLPAALAPGAHCRVTLATATPWAPGRYVLEVSGVQERVAWSVDVDAARGARATIVVGRRVVAHGLTGVPAAAADAFLAHWSAPASHGAGHGVNRYLEQIYDSRPDLQAAYPDLDDAGGAGLVSWAHTSGRIEHPIPDALLPPGPPGLDDVAAPAHADAHAPDAAGGVNVVGYLHGELGLGEAARLAITGLDAAGVRLLPVDAGLRDGERDGTAFDTVDARAAVFGTTVACANPPMLGRLRRDRRPEVRALLRPQATVAFMWWELEQQIPFDWKLEDLSWLHEVWVGSEHVRRCLEPLLRVPVVDVGLPIDPDPVAADARETLGLPDGFCFVSAFDYTSDLRRKNPLGVIQAFSAAFAPGSGVSLILKCTSAATYPAPAVLVTSAASAHPDIHVIDRTLPDAEYNALLAAGDCYVSLHRAEGFGLPLANAMHHGRPVIATAYSGNLDFMTPDNSYLVPARRTPVADSWRYPLDGIWAEPDIVAAIDAMRAVVSDPAAAAARGRQAANDIRRTHSPAVVGARMAQRLAAIVEPASNGATPQVDQPAMALAQQREARRAAARPPRSDGLSRLDGRE